MRTHVLANRTALLLLCLMLAAYAFPYAKSAGAATTGFYVSGTKLKDANGNNFVMRGVNNPHIWYDSQSYSALADIAAKGANAVRIVWSTSGTASRLQQIIDRCKELHMVAIVELHDVTGSNDASRLNDMAAYFTQSAVKTVINNNTKYALVNIANEWGGNDLSDTAWRDAYKTAISTLRNAGVNNTIVVDASGWGQNASPIKAYGSALLSHDPDHNIMFSLHMYGSWNDASRIGTELQAIQNLGLAVMIGEFGYNYNNGNNNLGTTVNAQEVMNQAQSKGIGYLAWSWTGNDSSNAWLDLASSSDWKTLTSWGNLVFYGTNGIASTSQAASVYGSSAGTGSSTVLYSFESGTQGWTGIGVSGGPWTTNEWSANGSQSLKADVMLGGGPYYLAYAGSSNLSGKTTLKATVKHAAWGNAGSGLQAKLYVKTGSSYAWSDGGTVNINSSSGTALTLSLSSIANLNDVKEIGIQFLAPSGSSGQSAVYVDNVTVQ
ncbi:cellulase family glycosylhydrolase [Cohnella sp. AR92]|uniref:cellulase family glycosylhydrolase n=1 Tax=Cohnella sp. AR92 TaxID=648716 RepID=UPI001EDF3F32|nr:cellulase family glycosylhydrolase [Cohnella sp. AR92]